MNDEQAPEPSHQKYTSETVRRSDSLLPPAVELERLERILPGAAARIFDRWDRQADHRQQLESRGLTYAFRIALAGLTVSLITILAGIVTGQTGGIVAGGAVGTIDLVALVYAFIRASSR